MTSALLGLAQFARCAPRLVELPNGVASHVAEVEFQDINPRVSWAKNYLFRIN
jgi:hypothetical protein